MIRGEIMSCCDIYGYEDLSLKIKSILRLEKSPVAIKLVLKEEDIPEGIPKIEENMRHCEMGKGQLKEKHFMQQLNNRLVKVELEQ
ncbi:MAG: DUF169 domain-containing protein [Methanobacterium sp.]